MSEDPRDDDRVLTAVDAAALQDLGLLSPVSSTSGSVRIHKHCLNRSSDIEYSNLPLTITRDSLGAQDAFVTIPVNLTSRETLLYVGYSEERSWQLWEAWTSLPTAGLGYTVDPDPDGFYDTFLNFIVAHVDNFEHAHSEDVELWRRAFDGYGTAQDLQDSILDQAFAEIRDTGGSRFWAVDTFEMRYAGLKEIQRTSRTRFMQ